MTTAQTQPGPYPVDDDLVRRLVAGQFPQGAGLAVVWFPSGGTVNAMYRLGDGMVVRLPLREGGAGDVPTEWGGCPASPPAAPGRARGARGRGARREVSVGWSVYRW